MSQDEIVAWLRYRADDWQKWRETYPELDTPRFDAAHALREAAMLLEKM